MAVPSLMHSFRILWLSGVITLSLSTANSQDWTYFQPAFVKTYGCRVYDTEMVLNGQMRGEMVWEAWAFAEKVNEHWGTEVGRFPYTPRGRHRAEKACSKWQDEAEKRVKAVQDR